MFPSGSGSAPGQNNRRCFSFQPTNDNNVEFTEENIIIIASSTSDVQFTQSGGNTAIINITDDDSKFIWMNASKLNMDIIRIIILEKYVLKSKTEEKH